MRNGTDEELVKVKFSFIHLGHSFNKQVLDAYYLSDCVLCLGYSGKKKKNSLNAWNLHSVRKRREKINTKYVDITSKLYCILEIYE